MENKKRKQIILSVVGILLLVVATVGITYAFFNYTRTGAPNNISTGRINFSTGETNTINLTNVFPISSTSAATDNVNSSEVTITVTGDTTYNKGIEYLVTVEDVTNSLGNKNIPINLVVTPEKTGDLGEDATDYWTQRGSTTSYYEDLSYNTVGEGQRVLVGYIAPGVTGINGTIGIRAYLDKDRIAISDTYPTKTYYEANANLTQAQVDECVSYLSGLNATEAFCRGTGTITRYGTNYTILEAIARTYIINNTQKEHLLSEGIVKESYTNGTTSTWVDGRLVLTTTEWNSLQSTPLSFKVKVEANEDVWVDEAQTLEKGNLFVASTTESSMEIQLTSGDIRFSVYPAVETNELGQSNVAWESWDLPSIQKYNQTTGNWDNIANSGEYGKVIVNIRPSDCYNVISNPKVWEFNIENGVISFPNVDVNEMRTFIHDVWVAQNA